MSADAMPNDSANANAGRNAGPNAGPDARRTAGPAASSDASPNTAAQPAGDRGPAPSPCVGVCRIVESEARCAGCLRTLDEIARWSRLDDESRHDLLAVLERRRQRAAGGGIE